jgi:hypothetical protein
MGGKCKKKRNWKEINEKYVREGELWIDEEALRDWWKKVTKKNKNKVGSPFTYPDEFMTFGGIVKTVFHLGLRQLEGFIKRLRKLRRFPKAPDYTTLSRRIPRLPWEDLPHTPWNKPIIIAQDSTGLKVAQYGDWMRRKWKVYRGFLKLHVSVNVKNHEVLGVRVTDERAADSAQFSSLIKQSQKKGRIGKCLADGAYDTNACFGVLEREGIAPGIRLRKTASCRDGTRLRRREARLRRRLGGQDAWRDAKDFGQRWQVESVYSAFKRRFGEAVSSKSFDGMVREVLRKAWVYNWLVRLC